MANLQGDYKGSCVACLQGTDSGVALVGEAEWLVAAIAFITKDPIEVAQKSVEVLMGWSPGMVASGECSMTIRVCEPCASKVGLPKPVLLIPGQEVPTMWHPS